MSQDVTYPCPVDVSPDSDDGVTCGKKFSSKNGAVMHGLNMSDEYHAGITSKPDAYTALDRAEAGSSPSEGQESSESPDDAQNAQSGLTAVMPDSSSEADDSDDSEDAEASCPECGAGLGMSETEALAFVEENGGAWCEDCGMRLVSDGEAA